MKKDVDCTEIAILINGVHREGIHLGSGGDTFLFLDYFWQFSGMGDVEAKVELGAFSTNDTHCNTELQGWLCIFFDHLISRLEPGWQI